MDLKLADTMIESPSGRVVLDIFRNGVLVEHVDEFNLIVDVSKQIHARLLGGDVTGRSITKIGFGTNGSAPVVGNAALTGQFDKNMDAVSYPAVNSVLFSFTLLVGEANGMAIFELGLLTTDGSLYARKVRLTALEKTTDISISGSWLITF